MSLANRKRPRTFEEMVGQSSEVAVLKTILEKNWKPSVILIGGPFGTGKTTLSRLIARALLCDDRKGFEPCGVCESCLAMDRDNHPSYKEMDAASHGQVADVRALKEEVSYQGVGKLRIYCFDEAHALTSQAQDAMLKMLEEGVEGVIFILATTEVHEVAPTIRSRCVELSLRLLTVAQIKTRLEQVCKSEGIEYEPTALSVIGSYVRGHMRDALVLLEQLNKLSGKVVEEDVRTYLRMDRNIEIYELLAERDRQEIIRRLEALLCSYSASELVEIIGQILLNVYKVRVGVTGFTQLDDAWLKKLSHSLPENILSIAEGVMTINTDFSSINYAIASIAKHLMPQEEKAVPAAVASAPGVSPLLRKPQPV